MVALIIIIIKNSRSLYTRIVVLPMWIFGFIKFEERMYVLVPNFSDSALSLIHLMQRNIGAIQCVFICSKNMFFFFFLVLGQPKVVSQGGKAIVPN